MRSWAANDGVVDGKLASDVTDLTLKTSTL